MKLECINISFRPASRNASCCALTFAAVGCDEFRGNYKKMTKFPAMGLGLERDLVTGIRMSALRSYKLAEGGLVQRGVLL
ncbi:hypothetical protein LZ31DRAFT_276300 [Colletotrichum somersetense]|nr:hypothetical protein LZ31DRAFT_276300 [Colletotrichum somersetense]